MNDTDVNGLAASVSELLAGKGFVAGTVGNNETGRVASSQIRAAKTDDLGAQAVSKAAGQSAGRRGPVGGARIRAGRAGQRLHRPRLRARQRGRRHHRRRRAPRVDPAAAESTDAPLPAPPIITAGAERSGVRELTNLGCGGAGSATRRALGPAHHLLRRRDRRAHRAVHGDARQLGGQDRQPAARRARRGPGQPGRDPAARALADPGRAARRLVRRRRSRSRGRRLRHRRAAPPSGSTTPTRPSASPARSSHCPSTRSAGRSPTFRSASPTTPRRSGRTATRSSPSGGRARPGRPVDDRSPCRSRRIRRPARGLTADSRVLSSKAWDTADDVVDVLAVLVAGGSLVQVAHPDPAAQDRRRTAEKVTAELA